MLRLDTGTPGAGKTLINVRDIVALEKSNRKNLTLNTKIYNSNKQVLKDKNIITEMDYLIRKVGQGVGLKDEPFVFEKDYFDLFASTDRLPDYFFRSIYYNEIIERINKEYSLTLNLLKPVRTIYTNIIGLEMDAVQPLPLDADWRTLPDGSYVVIDEIQNIPIFSSESRSVDPIVKELTIHRHRGFDIIGITQFPDLVHKNFRALTGHHRHLVNSFGLKRSTQYEWSTVKLDPNAFKNKATAEIKSTFTFPKDLYKYYRSATAHTHKRRLPWRFILIMLFALTCCVTLFTCTFSNDNNMIKKIATGGKNEPAPKNINNSSSPSTDINQTSSSLPTTDDDADTSSASDPAVSDLPASYDASDPFAYSPNFTPEPVNHRAFSGCFCSKKSCAAYDNQGTKIREINSKVCKDLMHDSSNRPFDYFNARALPEKTNTDIVNKSPVQNTEPEYVSNDVQPHLQRPINGANQL